MSTILEHIIEDDVGKNITHKYHGLGINNITIKNIIKGPIITGYVLNIPNDIPVSKITEKAEDIALSCNVESVDIRRINKDIYVFVPNKKREVVDFKQALFWYLKDEEVKTMNLPLLIGTDYKGEYKVVDLTLMPHILIAGSTGSGKSIFETSIIATLSMFLSPEQLEFYIVDTKQVDLTLFKDLKHVKKLAKNINEWYYLISYLHYEVDRRINLLSKSNCRNIQEFNKKADLSLSYIVLVIDELADLIERDKAERFIRGKNHQEQKVILSLQRLIQICRATGIHIITCTQRTSVDIINGVIKSNFPTRISLKLPTSIDSKVILDSKGAEGLLGNGDMLIKFSDRDNLERYHSPFVRLEDIELILNQREMILQSLKVER